ncbi:hypothetical protein KFL_003500150 [Klebsormidium nitens]|uniref:Uncharacterized protein n=1 Tax=Klebsormidium nitens TaxID=105231 RepID=A0A1Y1I8U7_KLENI|nr:hypothetical protein KFL_003500150 [Klebsormidium nitens]|eukprot:GAQ87404.1 hypothetical protein KFL_003500150 [Klebsormidium nitens]
MVLTETPYPARLTGIALGERKKTYIDVQVMNLGDAFVPSRFQNTYVSRDAPYLNLEGCVTFLELIKSKRPEKKYNIDEIRRQVIKRHLDRRLGGKKAAAWYEGLAKSFVQVFDGTEFANRNEGIIGRLLLRALDHLPGGAAAVEMCESQLIEALRPCINATIQAIDGRLSQASLGRIFVTGGDAMRRFDSGIRISKDIDTKIYVPPGPHLDDVVSLTTALVGKAVTMMVEERARILPRNIESVICGTPVGFLYRIRDNDNLQFRLRYLPKEPNGRPRLVSIDYRMRVRVGSLEFNHNIPVLDVVVQRAPKSTDPREASTKLPIAGLPWLVDDIKHTWQSSSRAKQRQHLDDVVSLATALVGKAVTIMVKELARILPPNVERVISGTPVGFLYRIRDNDNLQFRLRYLPKEPNGRPRLVSIDYRMRVRVGSLEFNHNVPVLDVVIQRAPKSTDPREASTNLPIAGLPWLVDDIKHTWQSSSRAKQRVWAGKREKNLARLQELQKRLDANRSAREGNLGRVDNGVLEYLQDKSKPPLIPDYLTLFAWAEARKRYLGLQPEADRSTLAKQSKKQKLPFSRTKLDQWRREMQSL